MRLSKGTSQLAVSGNIKTLVDDWKKSGSIGSSHPPTKKKAIKQAVCHRIEQGRQKPKQSSGERRKVIAASSFAGSGDLEDGSNITERQSCPHAATWARRARWKAGRASHVLWAGSRHTRSVRRNAS